MLLGMTGLPNPDHVGLDAGESNVIQRLERLKSFYDVNLAELTSLMAALQGQVRLADVEAKAHLFNEGASVAEVIAQILREKA